MDSNKRGKGLKRKQPTDNEDERAAYEDFLAWRRLAQKPHEEVEEESDGEYESEEESFSSSRNASSFSTPKPSTSSAFAQFEDQMRAKGFDNMAENRKIRKGVRRSKFAAKKPEKPFTRAFILLRYRNPKLKPLAEEIKILNRMGMGRVDIELELSDTRRDVLEKLKSHFRVLNTIPGGIKFFISNTQGISGTLLNVGPMDGGELKKKGIVYLAPAQIHAIPPIFEKAGVEEKCLKCKNSFDVTEIDEHLELCNKSTPGGYVEEEMAYLDGEYSNEVLVDKIIPVVPTLEQVMDKFNEWRGQSSVLFCIDQMAHAEPNDYGNRITIERADLLACIKELESNESFKQRANYPLLVNFQGELGSDLSGLRSDFCSFTTEFITGPSMKGILQSYKDYVDNAEEGEEELSGDYISKLLFGLGLVAAIGVAQCGFKEAGVWELSKNLSLDHPFNRGMQILQLAKFIKMNPDGSRLFCDGSAQPSVTAKMLIGLLHKERNNDKCSDLMELATMNYFSSFLKALEKGKIMTRKLGVDGNPTSEIIKATVPHLLHYVSGSFFLPKPPAPALKLNLKFTLSRSPIPIPTVKTCWSQIILPVMATKEELFHVLTEALVYRGTFSDC